jgi:hypothetical protein
VREGGRAIFLVGPPAQLERGITGESVSGDVTRQRLEAIGRLVDAGKLPRSSFASVLRRRW